MYWASEVKMLPEWFCSIYSKRYGVFLPSGTLAIEAALHLSDIPLGAYVLLPMNECWKISYAVQRMGLKPIFVNFGQGLVLSKDKLRMTLDELFEVNAETNRSEAIIDRIYGCLAVHHYGLPVNVNSLRECLPDHISLIEDCARAWKTKSQYETMGKHSDYVTTSFALNKPISLGYGGAVFFDQYELIEEFSLSRDSQFQRVRGPIPYSLPCPQNEELLLATAEADRQLSCRREFANIVSSTVDQIEGAYAFPAQEGDEPSWARIPIFFKTRDTLDAFIKKANFVNLQFQRPHCNETNSIPYIEGLSLPQKKMNALDDHIMLLPSELNRERYHVFLSL